MRLTLLRALPPGLLFALVASCGSGGEDPGVEIHWETIAAAGAEAFLAVGGTAADDVYVAGADKGQGPALLHWDGAAWTRLVPPNVHGDLWWIHAFPNGNVYFAGGRANVLRYDGETFTRMDTPGLARNTVFGLWGSSESDLWAVGSTSGRNGFIWRYDGTSWVHVPLPSDIPRDGYGDPPGLFKVWGRAADDVWIVGARGTLLHWDGVALSRVETPSDQPLFTVHGNDAGAVAVGGGAAASVLVIQGEQVIDRSAEAGGLIQGLWLAGDGRGIACGAGGALYQLSGDEWTPVDYAADTDVESLHAAWIDPGGGYWAVGGNVLTPKLDAGVIIHGGAPLTGVHPALITAPTPPDPTLCPEAEVDLAPDASIARRWNEQQLNAIRRDVPRPGVHARNLFHVSTAVYDAWAAFDDTADQIAHVEKVTPADLAAERAEAISFAAYRVLSYRYDSARAVNGVRSSACFTAFMERLGYDPGFTSTVGSTPAALGNRIAQTLIDGAKDDGANELNNYADLTSYAAANPPLIVDQPGTNGVVDPQIWQALNLAVSVTQNGIVIDGGVQRYIGSNWGAVTPFALARSGDDPYFEPIGLPAWGSEALRDQVVELIRFSSELDPNSSGARDISPGAFGDNTLGTDDGGGYGATNPVTGARYTPHVVPIGDFTRVLAEHWADGPNSETPPGHWNTIFNHDVSDAPEQTFQFGGSGEPLDRLEWDVKGLVALNAAVHDAAIAAWELKRTYLGPRPITLIRHMAELGQSTDPAAPSYDPDGLPLVSGLIELITAESSAPGARHAHLAQFRDQVAILAWQGEPGDTRTELGGIGWQRGVDWVPYQLRTFVTPAFPGYASGHSTFSRAAAEVLARVTGSEYFPGGFAEFVAPANAYLRFERGPSVDVHLQWASYYDAADQAGLSRRYGGIHVSADDYPARVIGSQVGTRAFEKVRTYFDGSARP